MTSIFINDQWNVLGDARAEVHARRLREPRRAAPQVRRHPQEEQPLNAMINQKIKLFKF